MCLIYISLFLPLGQHTVKTPGRRDEWPFENLLHKSSFTFDLCLPQMNLFS